MMRYFVAACASAALIVASLFLADIGPIWP
jgi:hypothetical protein